MLRRRVPRPARRRLPIQHRSRRSKLETATSDLPASQYIEASGDGYRIAGTRITLDSIAYAVRRGETVEDILADFPALQSRRKLEGTIAFIQSHPLEIGAYLAEQSRRWDRAREANPPDLVEKARRYRTERVSNPLEGPSAGRRGPPVRDRPRSSEVGPRHPFPASAGCHS